MGGEKEREKVREKGREKGREGEGKTPIVMG